MSSPNRANPYCNSYCYVVEMAGGKFQSLGEYLDTAVVKELWSRHRG